MGNESEMEKALLHLFQSPNVSDSNGETANLVDVGNFQANAIERLSWTISTRDNPTDLVTAVLEVAASMSAIATAIQDLRSDLVEVTTHVKVGDALDGLASLKDGVAVSGSLFVGSLSD